VRVAQAACVIERALRVIQTMVYWCFPESVSGSLCLLRAFGTSRCVACPTVAPVAVLLGQTHS